MDFNNTDIFNELNELIVYSSIPNIILVTFYIVIGSIGNATVVYIYCFSMKKKRTNQYFIPYLAGVDLTSCLFNGSMEIVFDLKPLTFDSDIGCKFIRFFGNILSILSGVLLVVIAVQRFLLICLPFAEQPSTCKKKIIAASVTAFTVVISAPKFLFTGSMEIETGYDNITGIICGINEGFDGSTSLSVYNILLILTAFVSLIILSVLYIYIVRAIYKRNKKLKCMKRGQLHAQPSTCDSSKSENENSFSVNTNKRELQSTTSSMKSTTLSSRKFSSVSLAKLGPGNLRKTLSNHRFSWMFLTITLLCVVTYTPRMTIENIEAGNRNYSKNFTMSTRTLIGFLECLYIFNSVVNPLIYGMFDREFRAVLKKSLFSRKL